MNRPRAGDGLSKGTLSAAEEFGRFRAWIALLVGAAAVVLGLGLRWVPILPPPEGDSRSLVWASSVFLVSLGTLLTAYLARPERSPAMLGSALIAAAIALVLPALGLLEPSLRVPFFAASLESAGGFALVVAAIRLSQASARRSFQMVAVDVRQKVQVVRATHTHKPDANVGVLIAGDDIQLGPGDDIPVDGYVVSGTGFVDESVLTGPTLPAAKRPGDAILAGSDTSIPDLVVRIAAPPEASLLVQREQRFGPVLEELSHPGPAGRYLFLLSILSSFAALGFLLFRMGFESFERWIPAWAAFCLAAGAGPATLVVVRGRFALLAASRAFGVILLRSKDLFRLANVRRWQIDPLLLAGAGEVESLAFDNTAPEQILSVAAALVGSDESPEAHTLLEALKKRRLEASSGAALRKQGLLWVGTVNGERWFMGTETAAIEEERTHVEKAVSDTLAALRARGLIVWLVGRQGNSVSGVVAFSFETSSELRDLATRLRASLLPGLPDFTRQAVARAAGIKCDGPPLSRGDASLLAEGTAAPSSGLRVRVLPMKPPFRLIASDETKDVGDADACPRILLPAIERFALLLGRLGTIQSLARLRIVSLTLLTPVLILPVVFSVGSMPSLGALIAIAAVCAVGPVPRDRV